MENGLLKLYKTMKELNLIAHPKPELEQLLADKGLERKVAYDNWKNNLGQKEREDYLKVFGG